ncbi:uncharacterized protein GBIM_18986 [Gryllus bimaculatus]|nr:uncharacterized protein GBIM_18986 [Gryllus bimaculatus]
MAYSSPPRNIDQLIKGRNAAHKLKHGSPKFRDVIRERCKNRVKENREKFVNLLRSPRGSSDLKRVLNNTILEELMSFSCIVEKVNGRSFEITNEAMIDEELQIFEECSNELSHECDFEIEQIMLNCDALLNAENYDIEAFLESECIDLIDCPVCEKDQDIHPNFHTGTDVGID